MSKLITNQNDVAEAFYKKYRPQFDAIMKNNSLKDVNESLGVDHLVMLGRQLDQFGAYTTAIAESYNGVGALGKLPQVALDVITASYGNSVLPLLASTQPIEEQRGLVYFRELRAQQNTGGFSEGQTIKSPLALGPSGDGTLGTGRKQVVVGKGDATAKEFTTTLQGPIVPMSVQAMIQGLGEGKDDGAGKLLTWGSYKGEVNYTTGEIHITCDEPVAKDVEVIVRYDIDVDRSKSLETIQAGLVTKEVNAEIYTLATDIGFFANFSAGKRFGRSNADMVAEDLTNALTDALNARVISALGSIKKNKVHWDQTPADGISLAEHKLSFIDAIARSEANLYRTAGTGSINRYVAGVTAASVIRALPGFQLAEQTPGQAISLYGYLDGVPVIRATGVLSENSVLTISNPTDYFNAPVAYCPYMPLMLTDTVQDPNNPFRSRRAAGVWAGVSVMNDNLVSEIEITPMTFN